MPHIIVEHSANLPAMAELNYLLPALHEAALATGVFPLGGLRTRAAKRENFIVADRNQENAFVHVTLRIGHGRDLATKQAAAEAIFKVLCDHLAAAFASGPLAISMEVQEIDPDLNYKHNNIHDYVKSRQQSSSDEPAGQQA